MPQYLVSTYFPDNFDPSKLGLFRQFVTHGLIRRWRNVRSTGRRALHSFADHFWHLLEEGISVSRRSNELMVSQDQTYIKSSFCNFGMCEENLFSASEVQCRGADEGSN
jgi:hypothetical protein